jgi:hypothetical protein
MMVLERHNRVADMRALESGALLYRFHILAEAAWCATLIKPGPA